MIRLTEVICLPQQPRCPACQANLQRGCWSVLSGLAFCSSCADIATFTPRTPCPSPPAQAVLDLIDWWYHTDHGTRWSTALGIHFYTPQEAATRSTAAHLDPWLGDRPDAGASPLRPGDDLPTFVTPPVLAPRPNESLPEVPD